MAHREDGSYVHFIEEFCEIWGRYGDKVYRRKRNGESWVYNYEYKPQYAPTVISKRNGCVSKAVFGVSNPRRKGFGKIQEKVYYYTPYFVYTGSYGFTCNSFFKLRFQGYYEVEMNGSKIGMYLAPRTRLNFSFAEVGEYTIKCYKEGRLYSQRRVIAIPVEDDIKEAYNNWLDEHLTEILSYKMPYFGRRIIYRRGISPVFLLQYMVGKTEQGILYRSSYRERFMYVRQPYVHSHTVQGDHFYLSQRNINTCWNAAASGFRQVWEKYHIRWFDANYRKEWKIVRQHNLWSKMIFRAGKVLGFNLEELSPVNWLPEVETLGDLITVCGYDSYGLNPEEINIRIF